MTRRAFTAPPRFGERADGYEYLPALAAVVCVPNPEAPRRLSLDTCIIGRVSRVFRNINKVCCCDLSLFARPTLFPPNVDTRNYDLDQCREVVEEGSRRNVATFPVDEIFSECQIIEGDSQTSVESILRRNSLSASPRDDTRTIFVLRFRLVEKESGGFLLEPLNPPLEPEMVRRKSEVLSVTDTNVQPSGKNIFKDSVKSVSGAVCSAKENVVVPDTSENLMQGGLPRRQPSPDKMSGSPSKPVGSQASRFRSQRSLELDSLSPNKRPRIEPDALQLTESREGEFRSTSWTENSEDTAYEDINKHAMTGWVSTLLEVDQPVIQSGRQTPIRLSLKRVRLNDSPPKIDDKHDAESNEEEDNSILRSTTITRRSMYDSGSGVKPDRKSEVPNLETGDQAGTRSSRRKSRTANDEAQAKAQTTTPRSHRTCRKSSISYHEAVDEAQAPATTPRRQRACKATPKSYEEMEEDCDGKSSEGSRTPLTRRTPARTLRKSVRTPKQNEELSSFMSPEDSETSLACRTRRSANKTPKTLSETPSKTPSKSSKTLRAKTPSRTPSKGGLTPSMPARASVPCTPMSALEQIRKNLHVSAVPASLPCRGSEYRNIFSFLENKIVDAAGGCMYISGVPGTGKTATVHAVIRSLKEQVEHKLLKDFQYIEVNGLRMTEPRQVFVQILKALTGQKCTPQHAQDILAQRFCSGSSKNKTVVLLVDEVDMLRNRRQDVIYNLFDWPSKPNSRLIVLTIANTMDLPERLLKGRVTSRLGLTRLTFQPYSYKQLQEIVMSRLQGSNCFNDDAVELVARKVAACSGDVRRALDICRRASELVEEGSPVTMPLVNKVLSQMMNSANVCSIKACSNLEKLFLQAVVVENERTGVEEATFIAVYRQFQSLCALTSTALINISEAMAVLNRLGASGLLLTEHSRADINQSIFLNVNADDVHYALTQTTAGS